jgi:hypothetical protein
MIKRTLQINFENVDTLLYSWPKSMLYFSHCFTVPEFIFVLSLYFHLILFVICTSYSVYHINRILFQWYIIANFVGLISQLLILLLSKIGVHI